MRSPRIALVLALSLSSLTLSSTRARAECRSAPGCLLNLGVGRLDSKLSGALAAGIFAGLAAGQLALHLEHIYDRPDPAGVFVFVDDQGRERLALSLVPPPEPIPYPSASDERYRVNLSEGQLSDRVIGTAIAVGGAALIAGMIAGILSKH